MSELPDAASDMTPRQAEVVKKMFDIFLQFSEMNRNEEGGASSSNIFNTPLKDKKTPKKKKKESNKKEEILKKKLADETAKRSKYLKELKETRLLAAIERREKLVEKWKSLLARDEENLQALKEKLNKTID